VVLFTYECGQLWDKLLNSYRICVSIGLRGLTSNQLFALNGVNTEMKKLAILSILFVGVILGIVGCSNSGSTDQESKMPASAISENQKVVEAQASGASSTPSTTPTDQGNSGVTIAQVRSTITTSVHLDGTHFRKGITCDQCHGKIDEGQQVKPPKDEVCLSCHGGSYDKLVVLLKDKPEYQNYNPHNPGHERAECYSCHKSHEPFELTCTSCHSIQIPQRFK